MILRLRYFTLVLDVFLLIGAFILAYFVRVGWIFSSDLPFEPYVWTSVLSAVAWVVALLVFRGYHPGVRFTRWIHLLKVFIAGLSSTAIFGLVYYFGQQELFSRLLLVYIFCFGAGVLLLFHLGMQYLEKILIKKGYGNVRVLLIGSNRGVKAFIQGLQEHHSHYVPVAILDGYGTKQKDILGVPVLGKLNILEETIEKHQIDAIVQGDNVEQVVNIVHFCEKQGLEYYLLPYLLGMYQDSLRIQVIEKPLITPERSSTRTLFEHILS